ncbi:flagellar basal body L-ring protein FlgH [Silvibacterium dinghuense]|uniref:Flagellar basal body L-ring protein FlgH n=1 Tax=Silvibacterium dinghuense TaxID=1560006 RepID=A0A4Q1SF09_9BACT|nr:flagellar basal body L-ring protein FlgH [Silvibacterium dinghuense]RXS95651.1 flagellar basal body L-ring protein FlgH [Silvibacterium dinghuense]GGH14698.1 flagellar L-ring protein [Silvibacterium dinghuense]
MTQRRGRRSDRCVTLCLVCLLLVPLALGDKSKKKQPQASKQTPPDAALNAYIARVRAEIPQVTRTPGSIWVDNGRMTRLSSDVRAAHIHDPIAIVVSESLTASTDGTVKNSRATTAASNVTELLGKLTGGNALNNLLNQSSSSGLTAQGQSVTDSSLSTTIGGEVVDELPNGMLVIQAVRELSFSQQTQTIKLRGLVRPEDISNYNQVTSTSISDLELEVVGKGIVNDYTYRQNPVVRFLMKLLVF